jgi:hypothetical protein
MTFVRNSPPSFVDRNGLVMGIFCQAFAMYLATALMNPNTPDSTLINLNRMYQSMCGDPPRVPPPGRPLDPDRGTKPPDPSLNRGTCPSWWPTWLWNPQPIIVMTSPPSDTVCLGIGTACLIGMAPETAPVVLPKLIQLAVP